MSIERAPLTALSSMATRQILAELAAVFGAVTGQDITATATGGADAAARISAGDSADVVILASDAMAALHENGHILPGSLRPFAASGIAVAVPAGAPRPDIADEAALRWATLSAGTLCCSTGPSGRYLMRLWRDWGVHTDDPERVRVAPPGVPVAHLLAAGEGDLGFQQLSELAGQPGIVVLGPLPPTLQHSTVFTAGIGSAAADPTRARDLIDFLTSDEADAFKRKHGMEPPEGTAPVLSAPSGSPAWRGDTGSGAP